MDNNVNYSGNIYLFRIIVNNGNADINIIKFPGGQNPGGEF